jgi:cysteine desulfurase
LNARRPHIISTQVEHKAVLEPLEILERRGFDVTYVAPRRDGWVEPDAIAEALRPDTWLVSVMHVNNETGVIQPISEIADCLGDHDAYLHVDAAQGFAKDLEPLRNLRIDLISASSHKIYGPKGIGALITRRRGRELPPLAPLLYGGGQERGLRPGTLPVPLLVGFGVAAELAVKENADRAARAEAMKTDILDAFTTLEPQLNGDPTRAMPHILNVAIPGVDAEAAMLMTKDEIAVSNGSACTSASYEPSHVLRAMGVDEDIARCSLRLSWGHLTPAVDWSAIVERVQVLR